MVRVPLTANRFASGLFVLALMGTGFSGPVLADGPSGHDIAERFAADAERTAKRQAERAEQQRLKRLDAERQRDETDMLARARAEAGQRQADLERQRQAREDAELHAEETRRAAEREVAERQRAEQERADISRREAERERAATESARRQAEAHLAEEKRRAAAARDRQAEADRVSDALRKAIEAREQQATRQPAPVEPPVERVEARPPVAQEPPARYGLTTDAAPGATRYTVLMLMGPGNKGIRRHNKTADPVLCTDSGCYVSNGATATAALMTHRKALGFGRTWGQRAGACQMSLTCVFRGVEAGGLPFHIQPVDMRVVRHDRREAQVVDGGSDCFLAAGRLGCRRPVRGTNYVIWLVPEKMAEAIGPALLEQALADGLPDSEQAGLGAQRR